VQLVVDVLQVLQDHEGLFRAVFGRLRLF
jgi:hypothetical protein